MRLYVPSVPSAASSLTVPRNPLPLVADIPQICQQSGISKTRIEQNQLAVAHL
jgi:hypothetical protein